MSHIKVQKIFSAPILESDAVVIVQSCEHKLATLGFSWNKQTSSGEVGNDCVGRAQCITIPLSYH